MPNVYRLLSGKISRRNIDGVNETHRAPYDFVPAAHEYAANKNRLSLVGPIDDDSIEAKEALVNSPATKPSVSKAFPDDIRKLDITDAQKVIQSVKDVAMLDKFLEQEVQNRPRARKALISAIEARRDQITAAAAG